jgi:hypothetical protein
MGGGWVDCGPTKAEAGIWGEQIVAGEIIPAIRD